MRLLIENPSLLFIILIYITKITSGIRNEELTFENGYPTQYLSGSIHYFRVHPSDWRDRLKKLRWAGFHAVQTYIEWSSHEPEPGVYEFSDHLNLTRYIKTAEEENLKVILRPGPFICSERDMGGLPYWILRLEPQVKLRTSDPKFMKYVEKWFQVLLPLIRPFMYENGGPVIMVQVENEYGNFEACDFEYLIQLTTLLKKGLGDSSFLFSTDNGRSEALKCVKIPPVFATVDFGPESNATQEFDVQRLFDMKGPLINSEFYTGWIDHWGEPHQTKSSKLVSSALENLLEMGASVNLYVFHGGTSFGFGAGSNQDLTFQACPTSYDYDAPLSEAGDLTQKYFAIRDVVKNYFPVPHGPPPPPGKKYNYGDILMTPIGSLFDMLPFLKEVKSKRPLTFEEIEVPNGLVAYQTIVHNSIYSPSQLSLDSIHDRGYVFIDDEYSGVASRQNEIFTMPIKASAKQVITIIVESQGRLSVGNHMNDFKGLVSTPKINGHLLENWKMIDIPLYDWSTLTSALEKIHMSPIQREYRTHPGGKRMIFFEGTLFVPNESSHPQDTFLRTDRFIKGYVWINGFLLGRFWTAMGPQYTLYVPHGTLQKGKNKVLILELEDRSGTPPVISFVHSPQIDGPTPWY